MALERICDFRKIFLKAVLKTIGSPQHIRCKLREVSKISLGLHYQSVEI